MNSQITLSVRGLLITLVALLALVSAYLLGGHGGGAPPASAAEPTLAVAGDHPGRIQMLGVGKATAVPDQLTFTVSVSDKEVALDDALAGSSSILKRVLAALSRYGVRSQDVQTTGLRMYPVYEYHSYAPPTLTGYKVTQRAQVKVRDLGKGGQAIAAAVHAGGNAVRATGIRLGLSDPEAAIARARDAAIEAAQAKAQQYAAATGESLGRVVTVRELSSPSRTSQPQAYNLGRVAADSAMLKGALPIRAGKDDLSVRVQVVWTLTAASGE
jgi:uncharacterized protein YggE